MFKDKSAHRKIQALADTLGIEITDYEYIKECSAFEWMNNREKQKVPYDVFNSTIAGLEKAISNKADLHITNAIIDENIALRTKIVLLEKYLNIHLVEDGEHYEKVKK